mmetsp:Transcript_11478/g.24789  ORF Transcript_11478/g.24789 Transcript_11478/m.24789 type:complete len:352 (-) Transcript_11478:254-1309(-)
MSKRVGKCRDKLMLILVLVAVVATAGQGKLVEIRRSDGEIGTVDTNQRLGICITGQLSRLELGFKVQNLVAPLTKHGFRVDVVALLGAGRPQYVNNRSMGTDSWFRSFEEVERYLKPSVSSLRVVEFKQPKRPRLDPKYYRNMDKQGAFEGLMKFRNKVHVSQWLMQQECLFHFLEMEVQNKEQYGFVMRLREDAVFFGELDLQAFEYDDRVRFCECEGQRGFNDKGMLVPRKLMNVAFPAPIKEFYFHADRKSYIEQVKKKANPESFVHHAMQQHRVSASTSLAFCPTTLSILGPSTRDFCFKTKFYEKSCWLSTKWANNVRRPHILEKLVAHACPDDRGNFIHGHFPKS